jgi:hypothetical protein
LIHLRHVAEGKIWITAELVNGDSGTVDVRFDITQRGVAIANDLHLVPLRAVDRRLEYAVGSQAEVRVVSRVEFSLKATFYARR